ncbi:hypothetical protein ACIFOE_22135 [Paenibacillus sp. NRS-1783]|uniref:hypothetical protein n=1 Tax=unclassified Paenibacillus TaxID=185978 RepID=UPI003D279E97
MEGHIENSGYHFSAKWPEDVLYTFQLPDGQSESGGGYTTVIEMSTVLALDFIHLQSLQIM